MNSVTMRKGRLRDLRLTELQEARLELISRDSPPHLHRENIMERRIQVHAILNDEQKSLVHKWEGELVDLQELYLNPHGERTK